MGSAGLRCYTSITPHPIPTPQLLVYLDVLKLLHKPSVHVDHLSHSAWKEKGSRGRIDTARRGIGSVKETQKAFCINVCCINGARLIKCEIMQ